MAGPCRGDCEAKQFQPAFIQLPSVAAQYGGGDHPAWSMGQAARNIPMEAGEKGAIVNKPKITGKRLFKMAEIV